MQHPPLAPTLEPEVTSHRLESCVPSPKLDSKSTLLVTRYTSQPNRNGLGLFTGGHVFDPQTHHSYYYYTTDRYNSRSGNKSNATIGLLLNIIESKILYQLKVKSGGLKGWF